MNRLGWIIILGILVVVGIKVFIQPIKNLSNIVSKQCSCSLDTVLSPDHQKKIIQSIQELHQTIKNPSEIIQHAVQEFPELKSMQAEICSEDTVCFHGQAVQPVFILNDQLAISDTKVSFKKENLDQDVIDFLPKLYSQNHDQYDDMVVFVQQIPQELTKTCTISWLDKNQIVFKPHNNQDINLIVSSSLIPTMELFKNCYELHDQNSKKVFKKKNNKIMVEYDIRFRNQIIVKSGGKYG